MDEFSGSQSSATVWERKRWQAIGKSSSPAFAVQAMPPAHLQFHDHPGRLGREVL
jgi:hypothetical protein